ncbi:MAG: site-2 protease family protein, partial [Solirubrobacterales bacterium]
IGAGPAVNIAIAFILLFGLALGENKPTELGVDSTESGTPAMTALSPGDRIVSIDGVAPRNSDLGDRAKALSDQLNTHTCAGAATDRCVASTPAKIAVVHDGVRRTLTLKPFYDADNERYRLGFRFQAQGEVPLDRSLGAAAGAAAHDMWFVTSRTFSTLGRIFRSEQRKQINGVVGSYEVTRQAVDFSPRAALTVLAVISLSLGVINLLPFLPLDGGHIFWSLVEKFRGRPVPFSVMERASVLGFALVLMLFAVGLFNDIGRLSGDGFNVR